MYDDSLFIELQMLLDNSNPSTTKLIAKEWTNMSISISSSKTTIIKMIYRRDFLVARVYRALLGRLPLVVGPPSKPHCGIGELVAGI